MMYPVIRRLLHKRVVLASASPRRQEILSNAVSGRGPGALWPRVSGQGGPGLPVCLQDGLGSWAGVCVQVGLGAWGGWRGLQLRPSDQGTW